MSGEKDHVTREIRSLEGFPLDLPDWGEGCEGERDGGENPGRFDIWKSIMARKTQEEMDIAAAAPYIHPLDKRSSSSLSDRSLEICTESLGSESGCDCFSAGGGGEEEERDDSREGKETERRCSGTLADEAGRVGKFRKSPPLFPPPLPSRSHEMKSRRESGRLVVDAVSVASRDYLRAERRDGRLLLSFVGNSSDEGDDGDGEQSGEYLTYGEQRDAYAAKLEEEVAESEGEESDEAETDMAAHRLENSTSPRTSAAIPIKGFNKAAAALPPRPTAAPIPLASLRPSEHRWRAPMTAAAAKNNTHKNYNNYNKGGSCKETPITKRSVLVWKPYATITTRS